MKIYTLSGAMIRDTILNQGKTLTESTAFFFGNLTKAVGDATKGAITADSGCRTLVGVYKSTIDFAKGDAFCGTLCCVSVGCELVSGALIWCPIPGKIVAVSVLKGTSMGCHKVRDLCSTNPASPLC